MSSEYHLFLRACRRLLIASLFLTLLVACAQLDDQRGGSAPAVPTAVIGGIPGIDPEAGGGMGDPSSPLLVTPIVPTRAEPTEVASTEESPRLDGTEVIPTRPAPEPSATIPLAVVVTPTQGPQPVEPRPSASPSIEATDEIAASPTAVAATPAPALPPSHVVAPGENLYRIGELYGLAWTAIAALNGISNPDQIVVGQELRLPAPIAAATPPTVDPAPEEPAAEATQSGTGPVGTHTVRPGDNVYRLSQLYGVSWVEIAEANGLITPNQIYVGQVLKIPVSRPGPTPEFTHRVRGGETLFRIALQYGVTLAALAEANGLQPPYVIYSGQTLIITTGSDD